TISPPMAGVFSLPANSRPGAPPIWLFRLGAAIPATSPPASTPATSTAPIETYQRIAALPSTGGNGDTQIAPRKGRTSSVLHIWVSHPPLRIRAKVAAPRLAVRYIASRAGGISCFEQASSAA